jgi:hypothetical protein
MIKEESLLKKLFYGVLFFLWMFLIFFYGEFPDAWRIPSKSLGLAKVHLVLAGCVWLLGLLVKKGKQGLGVASIFGAISLFYFSIYLIRTFF